LIKIKCLNGGLIAASGGTRSGMTLANVLLRPMYYTTIVCENIDYDQVSFLVETDSLTN